MEPLLQQVIKTHIPSALTAFCLHSPASHRLGNGETLSPLPHVHLKVLQKKNSQGGVGPCIQMLLFLMFHNSIKENPGKGV